MRPIVVASLAGERTGSEANEREFHRTEDIAAACPTLREARTERTVTVGASTLNGTGAVNRPAPKAPSES